MSDAKPIDDGGPAFPSGLRPSHNEGTPDDCYAMESGMSLRDYFAAKAMKEMRWTDERLAAAQCYRIADAMLKARNQ